MLKVAIVGCGRIADAHASQVRRISGCEIVSVCDLEPLMARQLAERFGVRRWFIDVDELLRESRPDVVHITTPPASHFGIAEKCLGAGCHVYVEKPFTVDAKEALGLIALAIERGLKLTVGHDDQFRNVARRMRALVQAGFLGVGPVHMESYYCYELGTTGYAGALLGDRGHWARQLPGGLLQNVISHGIARIAEHLTSESPQVIAHGFVSQRLSDMNEEGMYDELRVMLSEERGTTAYFTFSTQMRPSLHEFRIYGSKNGLALDQDHETLIRLRGGRLQSYAEKFVPPVELAGQYLGNLFVNVRSFLANDFHMKAGMKCLIERFYDSVRERSAVPIPYREIVLTARIMDAIFNQLAHESPLDRRELSFTTARRGM